MKTNLSSSKTPTVLLADIGGTHARFILEHDVGQFSDFKQFACADFQSLYALIAHYLQHLQTPPKHAMIAIAQPIDGDQIHMTNLAWSCSIKTLQQQLDLSTLHFINDFVALAYSLPYLTKQDLQPIGDFPINTPSRKTLGLLGAGTGLGVSGLIPIDQTQWTALNSEGGHITFVPQTEKEYIIHHYAQQFWQHISYERILSGSGLSLIYAALSNHSGNKHSLAPHEIVPRADQGDPLAIETLLCFSQLLGAFAGNLALTLGAKGGVYIGGGIAPKLKHYFNTQHFRHQFENKGRLSAYLQTIPTYLITAAYPSFLGLSAQFKTILLS